MFRSASTLRWCAIRTIAGAAFVSRRGMPSVPSSGLDGVRRAAYSLTRPMLWRREAAHRGSLPLRFSAAHVTNPGVLVETIKWAEDEDAMIVRLYEADGGAGPAMLVLGTPTQAVDEVDLLERNPQPVSVDGDGRAALNFRAREVKTVRITPSPSGRGQG